MQQRKSELVCAMFLIIMLSGIIWLSGCVDDSNPYNDPNTFYVSLDGKYDYTSIQQAIDDAPENYTIYILPGRYVESVLIDRSLTLIGENKELTIIDGNYSDDVLKIVGPGSVVISNLSLQNSGDVYSGQDYDSGIELRCNGNFFSQLNISGNSMGLWSYSAKNNVFKNITFFNNSRYGIYMQSGSNNNILDHCVFYKNQATIGYSLRIKTSGDNIVKNCYFGENGRGLYFCCGARDNIVYHNSFVNNSQFNGRDDIGNTWFNENLSEGNFWSDYTGVDQDDNGIGDTPYNISSDGEKQDPYPLMNPPIKYKP